MRLVFWLSAVMIVYVYLGYPVLLVLWARLRPKSIIRNRDVDTPSPSVSIVIAARNEAARLRDRIDNILALAYPADRLQVIVVSDGSTDDTPAVLATFGSAVETVSVPARGKAVALNAGVERATGEFVVFADARQMFAPDAISELVAPFADPTIGGVTGELLLDCEASEVSGRRHGAQRRTTSEDRRDQNDQRLDRRAKTDRRATRVSSAADGVGLYWRYEKQLRRLESTVGSTLGATGAIYALRRSLYRPLPEDTVLDDVLTPMRTVLAGYRVVFSERAFAFDRVAPDVDTELRRKIRTLAGNVQILALEPRLLIPVVNPVWLQYVSHKLGRLLMPYALLALFTASLVLAGESPVYAVSLFGLCGLCLLGGYGAWLEDRAARHANLTALTVAGYPGGGSITKPASEGILNG
jgi:cellulose synthase/poly-beta-1,6-N-acetylglucosamine synthase-like glycosyltransferase